MTDQDQTAWEITRRMQERFEYATQPLFSFQKLLFVFEEPPSEYELEWITDVLHTLCEKATADFNQAILEIRQKYCPATLEKFQKKRREQEQAELVDQQDGYSEQEEE